TTACLPKALLGLCLWMPVTRLIAKITSTSIMVTAPAYVGAPPLGQFGSMWPCPPMGPITSAYTLVWGRIYDKTYYFVAYCRPVAAYSLAERHFGRITV